MTELDQMITEDKLRLYKKYKGDIDGWAMIGTDHEKSVMTDSDWANIAKLISALLVIRRGYASSDFKKRTEKELIGECESELVVGSLVKLAEDLDRQSSEP